MDVKRIENGVREILKGIGVNLQHEDFKETPERVARFFKELWKEEPKFTVFYGKNIDQLIVIDEIDTVCLCPHHLMLYSGTVSIGYLPDKKIAGLSKFGRVVDYLSGRPQIQESLTGSIVDYLQDRLKARALFVVIRASHSCMTARGVKKSRSITITSAQRGELAGTLRAEFLSLVRSK